MATEVKFECKVCWGQWWEPSIPSECPDCGSSNLEKINTRTRDESNGQCSVGSPDEPVNCELIATHKAELNSDYSDSNQFRKICKKHKKLWEGSSNVVEINQL